MTDSIYKTAAVNAVKTLPKRLPGWLLGVYTAELIKLKAVQDDRKKTRRR